MKVSLISPKWGKTILSYPPLGLAYVAAALERAGHAVRIHVFSLDPNVTLEKDIEEVVAFGPDLVGITSMTNVHYSALQAADLVKERLGCPVVFGGPHASVFPERTMEEPSVDYVVFGEGEQTAVELADALQTGRGLEEIKGLCFRNGNRVQRNAPRPLVRDLDSIPFPARHLLELDRFPLHARNRGLMTTLLSSRGCPFDCSYCYKGLFGRTYRQRSPGNVLSEIKELVEIRGIKNFYFIDDYFTSSLRWLTELCNGLVESSLDIRWQCPARADILTPDLLDLMHKAGCRAIHFGVESGNQEILNLSAKHISLDSITTAVTWTKQAGMLVKGYFMLGMPGDTERTVKQTIRLACNLDLDDAEFSITTPYPGTTLWQEFAGRNPSSGFDRDLAKAFYLNVNAEGLAPFLNVSEVPDKRLEQLASSALRAFGDHQRKKKYVSLMGKRWGTALWHASRIKGTRRLGHYLQRFGLLSDLRGDPREVARVWS